MEFATIEPRVIDIHRHSKHRVWSCVQHKSSYNIIPNHTMLCHIIRWYHSTSIARCPHQFFHWQSKSNEMEMVKGPGNGRMSTRNTMRHCLDTIPDGPAWLRQPNPALARPRSHLPHNGAMRVTKNIRKISTPSGQQTSLHKGSYQTHLVR